MLLVVKTFDRNGNAVVKILNLVQHLPIPSLLLALVPSTSCHGSPTVATRAKATPNRCVVNTWHETKIQIFFRCINVAKYTAVHHVHKASEAKCWWFYRWFDATWCFGGFSSDDRRSPSFRRFWKLESLILYNQSQACTPGLIILWHHL